MKTKQQKISDGVEKFVSEAYWYEGKKNIVVDITKKILVYLASEGAVLRVHRELPDKWSMQWDGDLGFSDRWFDDSGETAYELAQGDMIAAGYVTVEPLIKE